MQPADERSLIRRASLGLETRDVTRVERVAGEMARASGGYIQSSVNDGGALRMTVRVAVARLDATLDTLSTLGKVTSRSQSTDDVTEQLVDLDARIASLTLVRDRMREHLRQAASLADVFTIERELARIQADLDSLIARRKTLGSLVELAELSITAHPKVRLGPLGIVAVGVGRFIERLFVLE